MTTDYEGLPDQIDSRPLQPRERVCNECWIAYNSGLTRCPQCELTMLGAVPGALPPSAATRELQS